MPQPGLRHIGRDTSFLSYALNEACAAQALLHLFRRGDLLPRWPVLDVLIHPVLAEVIHHTSQTIWVLIQSLYQASRDLWVRALS